MIGSVTVVPAVLAALGNKVEKGGIPFLGRLRRDDGESRLWNAVLGRVLGRPLVSAIAAAAVLLALAAPALNMHLVNSGTKDLPRKLEVMRVYDRIDAAFPGGQIPAIVTIHAKDVTTPQIAAATRTLERRAVATGHFNGPFSVTVSRDRQVALVNLPIKGDGTNAQSQAGLAALRGGIVDSTIGAAPGVKAAYVDGMTAQQKDFSDLMKSRAPLVFAFVLTLAFLLLLFTFRSIVIPIKAIVLNLLSVGAAYGVLTWIFQDGHLQGLLGFHSNHGVTAWLPMFLFVILFGLSMDYHVFILSRVKEAVDRGRRTEDAVVEGIKATAGTVTSAAIVMVAVFAVFATLTFIDFKEMGVGLAVAILVDATIVRGVLLPATMKLLGRWNWYLPSKLGWLPHFSHEPQADPAAA
jgi:RND superfamily putative drug exporter